MSISLNCDCACTNEQFGLIDTPDTENGIKCFNYGILWKFEVLGNCDNCVAMEQFIYIINTISLNCDCACTNEQFGLIDTPDTENGIKCFNYGILWKFEVLGNCDNCVAMEQFIYIINTISLNCDCACTIEQFGLPHHISRSYCNGT